MNLHGETDSDPMLDMLRAAFLAGWSISGEGYNAEHGLTNPEGSEYWVQLRDDALAKMLAERFASLKQKEPGR